jgi:hypothetical protein
MESVSDFPRGETIDLWRKIVRSRSVELAEVVTACAKKPKERIPNNQERYHRDRRKKTIMRCRYNGVHDS